MTNILTPVLVAASYKREQIRKKIKEGLEESFPVVSRNHTLEINNVKVHSKEYSSSDQKRAILAGHTLTEPVTGTLTIKNKNGKILDRVDNFTLARMPWFTPRHTMIVKGNEYTVANQLRSKPGVYTRKRANGVLEASFNTSRGKNFAVTMDGTEGIPSIEYGASKIPLYPILRSMGVSHDAVADKWGHSMAKKNLESTYGNRSKTVDRLYRKVVPTYNRIDDADTDVKAKTITSTYLLSSMDPNVNEATLGKRYNHVNTDALLAASGKIIKIHKNEAKPDDRENLDFKALHSVDDFIKERIKLDARDVARKASIKMETNTSLRKAIPSGPFTAGILKFINTSQLVSVPTQTNPVELIDAAMRVTSMGEGGIGSDRAIPEGVRHIHPTQLGALDPFRTPETFRAGVDVRAAMGMHKDEHNNIYVPLRDTNTNQRKFLRAGNLAKHVIAFPNQKMSGKVDALVNGKLQRVTANSVQYVMSDPSYSYSATTNLVPMMESLQGNRVVMGSKMQTQALSLTTREEPYIQVKAPMGNSFENLMAREINPIAPVNGTIAKVDKDYIYINPDLEKTGSLDKISKKRKELVKVHYSTNFPFANKTTLHHHVTVKKGDRVKYKQQLASSNFTKNGVLALGKNMSVAYMPYYGKNSNDAIVISSDAAKKLTSERMYKVLMPLDNDTVSHRETHKNYYGHGYSREQYNSLDNAGIIKPGTIVHPKDPLILNLKKSTMSSDDMLLGKLNKSLVKPYREKTEIWNHGYPGEVIDVVRTPTRIALTIKTQEPATIGDKVSGRAGNKGVVSHIIPSEQMIKDESGKPIDILMTSAGVVSRTNPAIIVETALGKVVEKTGKPILLGSLSGRDNVKWAKDLLKKHNIKDKETVFDPLTGKKIKNVFVGRQYIMKLMKSTDTNYSARGLGGYDLNEQPTKGGDNSAKALGRMEVDALIGHNARNVLQETSTIKGQRNSEYWRATQLGLPTPPPKTSFAYNKFMGLLNSAGVKTERNGQYVSLGPLTDHDTLKMSNGAISKPLLVKSKNGIHPEIGGLFDPGITGGLRGTKWSHINLAEPIVSPVFRDPVRHLLGLTNPELDVMIQEEGGTGIRKRLAAIDIHKKEKDIRRVIHGKKADNLDTEIKQLKYIAALKERKLTPDKAYIVSKVPVLPPVYRPISPGTTGQDVIYGDANPLYRDLLYTNDQFAQVKKTKLLPSELKRLRPILNNAVGAVYGVNEPISAKSQARGHKGALTYISGVTSPKTGFFHKKVVAKNQDMAGRGTIVPDSTLGLNEIGLPEDMIWDTYGKFAVKRLVGNGYSVLQADKMVNDKHPAAKDAILQETANRPVLFNRAPTLHRYSMMGAYPKMVPGKTIRLNPFAEEGTNSDYDGDSVDTVICIRTTKDLILKNFYPTEVNNELASKNNLKLDLDTVVLPGYYVLHIRDFPRIVEGATMKDNKTLYQVPKGVFIFNYAGGKHKVELQEVTTFSVHTNLDMLMLTTKSGRNLKISKEDSLFGFNPESCKMERFSALDHLDWAIPRVNKIERNVQQLQGIQRLNLLDTTKKTNYVKDHILLSKDVGWFLGSIVGDGWISYQTYAKEVKGHILGLAVTCKEVRDSFLKIAEDMLLPGTKFNWHVYDSAHDYKGHASFSSKIHINNAQLAHSIGSLFKHRRNARNKRLPNFFVKAPQTFLLGLLGGLIDTDGTVSIVQAKAKKKPQIIVNYTTISPELANDITSLALLLDVKTNIHVNKRKTDAGNKVYTITFSTPDLAKIATKIPCRVPYKKKNLQKLAKWDFTSNKVSQSTTDIVPIPLRFIAPLTKALGSIPKSTRWKQYNVDEVKEFKQINSYRTILTKAKKVKTISRITLHNLIKRLSKETVIQLTSKDWIDTVLNENIIWDFIADVEAIEGKHTAWDITVPEGKTFMTANGVIVYDTMMIHVPVGDKAVSEVKNMTLSKLLYSDKAKGDMLVFPQHEAIMGIASASQQDNHNKAIHFKNINDAKEAYYNGTITLGTHVSIGKK